MTSHRTAYTVSCIKPQMRARPDIRPAIRKVRIKTKLRAFTDIDPLNHYTFTPQTRAHPDIGQTRISNFNGLASAAKAGACKKCRVTGKYNGREHESYTGTHAPATRSMLRVEHRDCTHNVLPDIIGTEHRRLTARREGDGERHRHHHTAPGGPAINEEHEHEHRD